MLNDNETSEFLINNNTFDVSSQKFDRYEQQNGVDDVKVFDTNGEYVDTILTDANHFVTSENVAALINGSSSPSSLYSENADDGVRLPCTTNVSIFDLSINDVLWFDFWSRGF